ncbi:hypothetical protein J2X36_005454 [Methylobacterium sp. BE186]|uniref:hypothetical protein n=1 Tax=Methylobacterium sp. BE186 TaxID=2817715 RepID=UPI002855D97D|nr:hypothetical protein [Methylobacterium sp. BE186]MDR7040667.1 hypothetical protein [Methylobacterium sp. BE186]
MAGRQTAAILWVLTLSGCGEPPFVPDVAYLATDAHLTVGGQQIVLPLVAVGSLTGPLSYRYSHDRLEPALKRRLREMSGDPAKPLPVEQVEVSVAVYGTHGETAQSQAICPRLTRRWSRHLCRHNRSGVLLDVPERFALTDRNNLALYRVGNEKQTGRLAVMGASIGEPEVACDQEGKFCKAVVSISPRLVAVWSVWNSSPGSRAETAQHMAKRQGEAIVTFVRNAIGSERAPSASLIQPCRFHSTQTARASPIERYGAHRLV